VTQIDLLSSLAALAGSGKTVGDSENLIDTFLGKSQVGRESFVLEATSRTALRAGDWIMIPPYQGPEVEKNVVIELGNSTDYQLYNLKEDIGQQNNLAQSNPEKLQEMISLFESIRSPNGQQIQQLELK
jgi:arylsulfatase A-like enzyme